MSSEGQEAQGSAGEVQRQTAEGKRWRRWAVRGVVVLVVGLVVCELVARFGLGVGNPVLTMGDPDIEYLHRPGREYVRLGNRIEINAYSMRSEDFPREKANEEEVRVLVVGDSVVYGGSRVDQEELMSEVLKRRVEEATGRPVTVGNVSANSWGPGNELAYLRAYGTFDADMVFVVLNSGDYGDVPTFEGEYDEERPRFAMERILGRYLPGMVGRVFGGGGGGEEEEVSEAEGVKSLEAVKELEGYVQGEGAELGIVLHPMKNEVKERQHGEGYGALREVTTGLEARVIEMGSRLREAMERGEGVYLDAIHPNARGLELIADEMFSVMVDELEGVEAEANGARGRG